MRNHSAEKGTIFAGAICAHQCLVQIVSADAAPRWRRRDVVFCAMMMCTLIYFVNGTPFVVAPYKPLPEKKYELYVWTERGEACFSEDAANDQALEYGLWPENWIRLRIPDEPDWLSWDEYPDLLDNW